MSEYRRVTPPPESTATAKARALLEDLRRTPMTRGNRLDDRRRSLRAHVERTIEDRGVPQRLAARIALQLVIKFDVAELEDPATWRAIGELLRREIDRLETHVGLVERQIIVALPKLSAKQVEDLLEEFRANDPTIARTILNTALDAAEPLTAGRRYLAQFHDVVQQFKSVNPGIARTMANATFMARVPRRKAMDHFKRFVDLMVAFQDDVDFVRTVARSAFRAPDPIKAARSFIADYDAIVVALASKGVECHIARSLAGIAALSADPMPTAYSLLQKFETVLRLVKETHPGVARSIALSACRATEPLSAARLYMNNYDTIVRVISQTDPRRAPAVASQAFRSDNPLRWAKRYLAELQQGGDPANPSLRCIPLRDSSADASALREATDTRSTIDACSTKIAGTSAPAVR